MFLKSVRIENFRCLKEAEIDFETEDRKVRKWTIMVGDNGAGKSTVLKATALLMAGSEALKDLPHEPGEWVRNGARKASVSAVLTTARGQERNISLTIQKGMTTGQLLKANEGSLKALDDALAHTTRSYLTIAYGGSRHSDASAEDCSEESDDTHPRARASATLFSEHAPMIPVDTWAMNLHSRKDSAGMQVMSDALAGLLPNVTFHRLDPRRGELIFRTPDGLVPLKRLSAGYRAIVGFCGDLLYRITGIFDDYRRPLEARGLLLIDELGLHLHPAWQRTLMDFLTEKLPNFQLLVTTNAPVAAHQAGQDELYYLRRHEPGGPPVLHHFDGAPNKLLLHQLILSPVFGVETANSHSVECDRKEYRKLKSKKRPSTADRKRMAKLSDNLEEVTQWDEVTEEDRKMSRLLSRIERQLAKR